MNVEIELRKLEKIVPQLKTKEEVEMVRKNVILILMLKPAAYTVILLSQNQQILQLKF